MTQVEGRNDGKANMLSEFQIVPWTLHAFEGISDPVPVRDFAGKHEKVFIMGRDLGYPTKFKMYLQTSKIESRPYLWLGVFIKLLEKSKANEVRIDFKIKFPKPSSKGEIIGDFLDMALGFPNVRGEGGMLIDEGDDYGQLPLKLDPGDLHLEAEVTLYIPKPLH